MIERLILIGQKDTLCRYENADRIATGGADGPGGGM